MSNAIPDGWALQTVGKLSNVKRGASPRPINDPKWWGGNVGWVRISDVTASRKYLTKTTQYLSDEGVEKSVKIDKGEVILSICATIGRPIIVSVDACIHDGFVWFNDLNDSIDREYWYYFLASKEEFLSAQRQSGTQGNLNTSIVSELACPLPPLPEQQKIAAILSSVDDVIEKTQAQIDKLKDLKTGMMQELLTKGIGHTEFKDSPVGRIPVGWDVVKMSEMVRVVDSLHQTPSFSKAGLPMIRVSDIRQGKVNTDKALTVNNEIFELFTRNHKPQKGDLLMSRVGSYGVCCYIDRDIDLCLGQNTVVIIPNKIDYLFLYYCISSTIVQNQIELEVAGSGYKSLSLASIRELNVVLPKEEEQRKIASSLGSVDTKIEILGRKLSSINNTKKALMQDLLTGKVRVAVPSHLCDHGISASMHVEV